MYRLEDKKIIFEDRKAFLELPLLGFGAQGDVYKIKIGDELFALKVFNGLNVEKLSNYRQKMRLDIESYISPKRILYVNDRFAGYLMKFCKGKDLEKRKLDITVDEFAESTVKLMKDTHKLGLFNYNIYDAFLTNVMYDNGFKMIDIDNYPFVPGRNIKEIDDINNRRLNQMLCEIFIKNANLGNLYFSNVDFRKLMKRCEDGDILFEELFNTLCSEAFNIAGSELEKISEVGKVLSKSKKR